MGLGEVQPERSYAQFNQGAVSLHTHVNLQIQALTPHTSAPLMGVCKWTAYVCHSQSGLNTKRRKLNGFWTSPHICASQIFIGVRKDSNTLDRYSPKQTRKKRSKSHPRTTEGESSPSSLMGIPMHSHVDNGSRQFSCQCTLVMHVTKQISSAQVSPFRLIEIFHQAGQTTGQE